MSILTDAHQLQQAVATHGHAAVPYPTDPKDRQRLQAAVHQSNNLYGNGMKLATKRMLVDGELLLVAWRTG